MTRKLADHRIESGFGFLLILNLILQIVTSYGIYFTEQRRDKTESIKNTLYTQHSLVNSYRKMILMAVVGLEYSDWNLLLEQRRYARSSDTKANISVETLKEQWNKKYDVRDFPDGYPEAYFKKWSLMKEKSLNILRSEPESLRKSNLISEFNKVSKNLELMSKAQLDHFLIYTSKSSNLVSSLRLLLPAIGIIFGLFLFMGIWHFLIIPLIRQKSDYQTLVQILCHDISNPLFIMTGYSKYLKTIYPDDTKIQAVDRSAQLMANIVKHVKQLQILTDDKTELPMKPVKVSEVIEDLKFIFEDRLKEKNLDLVCEIEPELTVMAERHSLCNEVLGNLLSNAIKFSWNDAKIKMTGQTHGTLICISVQDFGTGIPPHKLSSLFEPTKNRSTKGTRGESGTGYGLPLVKNYMIKYGGSVDAQSKTKTEDQNTSGTRFNLYFPV